MFPSIMNITITQTATIEILAPPATVQSIVRLPPLPPPFSH
jgi:hypothetical protein